MFQQASEDAPPTPNPTSPLKPVLVVIPVLVSMYILMIFQYNLIALLFQRACEDEPSSPVAKRSTLGDKCTICGKKVYIMERIIEDMHLYHRTCIREKQRSLRSPSRSSTQSPAHKTNSPTRFDFSPAHRTNSPAPRIHSPTPSNSSSSSSENARPQQPRPQHGEKRKVQNNPFLAADARRNQPSYTADIIEQPTKKPFLATVKKTEVVRPPWEQKTGNAADQKVDSSAKLSSLHSTPAPYKPFSSNGEMNTKLNGVAESQKDVSSVYHRPFMPKEPVDNENKSSDNVTKNRSAMKAFMKEGNDDELKRDTPIKSVTNSSKPSWKSSATPTTTTTITTSSSSTSSSLYTTTTTTNATRPMFASGQKPKPLATKVQTKDTKPEVEIVGTVTTTTDKPKQPVARFQGGETKTFHGLLDNLTNVRLKHVNQNDKQSEAPQKKTNSPQQNGHIVKDTDRKEERLNRSLSPPPLPSSVPPSASSSTSSSRNTNINANLGKTQPSKTSLTKTEITKDVNGTKPKETVSSTVLKYDIKEPKKVGLKTDVNTQNNIGKDIRPTKSENSYPKPILKAHEDTKPILKHEDTRLRRKSSEDFPTKPILKHEDTETRKRRSSEGLPKPILKMHEDQPSWLSHKSILKHDDKTVHAQEDHPPRSILKPNSDVANRSRSSSRKPILKTYESESQQSRSRNASPKSILKHHEEPSDADTYRRSSLDSILKPPSRKNSDSSNSHSDTQQSRSRNASPKSILKTHDGKESDSDVPRRSSLDSILKPRARKDSGSPVMAKQSILKTKTDVSKPDSTNSLSGNKFSAFTVNDSVALTQSDEKKEKPRPQKSTWQIETEARQGIRQKEPKAGVGYERNQKQKAVNQMHQQRKDEGKTEWQIEAEKRAAMRGGKYEDPEFRGRKPVKEGLESSNSPATQRRHVSPARPQDLGFSTAEKETEKWQGFNVDRARKSRSKSPHKLAFGDRFTSEKTERTDDTAKGKYKPELKPSPRYSTNKSNDSPRSTESPTSNKSSDSPRSNKSSDSPRSNTINDSPRSNKSDVSPRGNVDNSPKTYKSPLNDRLQNNIAKSKAGSLSPTPVKPARDVSPRPKAPSPTATKPLRYLRPKQGIKAKSPEPSDAKLQPKSTLSKERTVSKESNAGSNHSASKAVESVFKTKANGKADEDLDELNQLLLNEHSENGDPFGRTDIQSPGRKVNRSPAFKISPSSSPGSSPPLKHTEKKEPQKAKLRPSPEPKEHKTEWQIEAERRQKARQGTYIDPEQPQKVSSPEPLSPTSPRPSSSPPRSQLKKIVPDKPFRFSFDWQKSTDGSSEGSSSEVTSPVAPPRKNKQKVAWIQSRPLPSPPKRQEEGTPKRKVGN